MSLNLELKRAREAKNAAKKGQGPPKEVVVTIFKSIQEETAWRIEQMMAHPVKPPSPSPSPSPPLWLALHAGLPIRWSCVLPLCAPCLVYRAARLQIGRRLVLCSWSSGCCIPCGVPGWERAPANVSMTMSMTISNRYCPPFERPQEKESCIPEPKKEKGIREARDFNPNVMGAAILLLPLPPP